MAKKKQIHTPERNMLTAEDLKRYEAGEMTFQEMNRVEKLLLEQPFYANAAEGFSDLKKDKVSVDKNLIDLKTRLGNRIHQSSKQPKPVFTVTRVWKPISIAAAILLVFSGTYYILDDKQKEVATTVMMKQKVDTESLSEPAASAPIAKEDNTAFNQAKTAPQVAEKRKQVVENSNQAQAVVRESEALPPIEEIETKIISHANAEDKIAETPLILPAGAAPAPIALEKKAAADRDEATVESKSAGGAGRMAVAAISGTVVNEYNEPMKDVTVNIKGKADGIRTNDEGKFSLRDTRQGDIIIFNSPKMPQMEVPLKNNLPGRIVYSEQNIKIPSKSKVSVSSPNEVTFEKTATDAKPEFGWEAFEVYMNENTKRPPKALQANIQGRVIVNFVVNEKGELADFTIIRSLGYGCDEEAIRLIKNGPKWFPATKDDTPISSSKHVIVKFR